MQVCSSRIFCSLHSAEEMEQILHEPESGHVALVRHLLKKPSCFVRLSILSSWQAVGLVTCLWERSCPLAGGRAGWFLLPVPPCNLSPFGSVCFLHPARLYRFGDFLHKRADPSPPGAGTLSPRLWSALTQGIWWQRGQDQAGLAFCGRSGAGEQRESAEGWSET